MSIFALFIVGLISGWLAKVVMPGETPGGLFAYLMIGVVGSLVGGWLFMAFGYSGATGVNLYSILVSTLGAIVFLFIWSALSSGRSY